MYLLQHFQFSDFFYEEELHNPIYHYNEFEDDYEDEGIFYGRRRRFANPNPNRIGGFSTPNRGSMFLNSIRDKGGGYSNPYEIRIPSFDGNLSNHLFFGLMRLISYLTCRVFLWKSMSSLWLINLKEGQRLGGVNYKT